MSSSLESVLDTVRLIDPDGSPVPPDRYPSDRYAIPADADLVARYRSMVLGRRINDQASALTRQGRLAVYPSSHGQEACQVAAAAALRPGDWLFPTYRDTVAVMERGVDPVEILTWLKGDRHCAYDPLEHHVAPQTTPLATQLLHAVGVAHAGRLQGQDVVAMALCGDGATSEGDFHEALNFAAVFRAPVVFLVQNNKYAISVPLSRQTAAPSLAHKGVGYGVPAVLVDGNDVAALDAVLREAVAHAAAGGRPVLVEADTYRVQAHTNADDPTRYRTEAEVEEWRPRDPIARLRTYLRARGALDDAQEATITAEAEALAATVRDGVSHGPAPDPDDLFEHVFSAMTPQLRAQRDLLREELVAEGADR
ncbi:pyruvate dehydrogenase (acetyl-transferring) E1 component subunit alpha [Actinotalea ferrariae]|uniref:pyruvate dehydrogenase (acetyl-transferring) E1 component subunit alpha n=1 Tax=Actinotalea ferrariae TaxID=1386098 RepID=UPI001C8B5BDD|nr:pyruvate dehydrogenase (acetyl-transferring) E1 component subunit alpha [Actinotalea ferrariae]MBX9244826.1 pyruvate dehydrogenase (acetyl-transferring) E1 component subunit alpha [Actinotalea ferrariae]